MLVYRVENHKGHGPIFGFKSIKKIPFDYRGTRLGENMLQMPDTTEEDLYGFEDIGQSYQSRHCLIEHKTPRENKPFFTTLFNTGGHGYFFGYRRLEKCRKFVTPLKKRRWILKQEGFKVVIYEVNPRECIIFPDGQIAFKKNKAKIISELRHFYS